MLRDVARALLSCLPPGALPPFTLACCLLLSLAFPQVPVEMVQFTDLVFGKLLGEGSGEQEVGGRRRAGTLAPGRQPALCLSCPVAFKRRLPTALVTALALPERPLRMPATPPPSAMPAAPQRALCTRHGTERPL